MDKKCYDLDFYVESILTNRAVIVFCKINSMKPILKNLKARRQWFNSQVWEIKYKTNSELANILDQLRKEGALFSSDPYGWGPSEVFYLLKEKGFIDGMIKEISWLRNGICRVNIKDK